MSPLYLESLGDLGVVILPLAFLGWVLLEAAPPAVSPGSVSTIFTGLLRLRCTAHTNPQRRSSDPKARLTRSSGGHVGHGAARVTLQAGKG